MQPLKISKDRLWNTLTEFARIGADAGGGITRLCLSLEEREAHELLAKRLHSIGAIVRVDGAGNTFGKLVGRHPELPAIAIGSHLDTVTNGGMFDGALGVLGGLEVFETIAALGLKLNRSLELICFTGEESSRFGMGLIGSRVTANKLSLSQQAKLSDGKISLEEAFKERGFSPSEKDIFSKSQFLAYLELHIEQGKVLESGGIDIGLVTHIGSSRRYSFILTGNFDHTGTTPMDLRKDALCASAECVLAVEKIAREFSHIGATATVTIVHQQHASWNTVPGWVKLSIDTRCIDNAKHLEMVAQINAQLAEIVSKREMTSEWTTVSESDPPMELSSEILKITQELSDNLKFSYKKLPCLAGHDAQNMPCPVGMIFIPSKDGKSHSPEEYSSPEQCSLGVELLLETVLALDKNS